MSCLSERLTILRKKNGYTRKHVCEALDIGVDAENPTPILANYERGARTPNIDLIADFARFYNVSADYLLGITDSENPANATVRERFHLSDRAISNLEQIVNKSHPDEVILLDCLLSNQRLSEFLQLANDYAIYAMLPDEYKNSSLTLSWGNYHKTQFVDYPVRYKDVMRAFSFSYSDLFSEIMKEAQDLAMQQDENNILHILYSYKTGEGNGDKDFIRVADVIGEYLFLKANHAKEGLNNGEHTED